MLNQGSKWHAYFYIGSIFGSEEIWRNANSKKCGFVLSFQMTMKWRPHIGYSFTIVSLTEISYRLERTVLGNCSMIMEYILTPSSLDHTCRKNRKSGNWSVPRSWGILKVIVSVNRIKIKASIVWIISLDKWLQSKIKYTANTPFAVHYQKIYYH